MNRIHEILRDPDCKENLTCLCVALTITGFFCCALVYGMAMLTHDENIRDLSPREAVQVKDYTKNITDLSARMTVVERALQGEPMATMVKNLEDRIMPAAFKGGHHGS